MIVKAYHGFKQLS